MATLLNEQDVRILGALIEKELTTPEYYPLSLNSLTNACNQKSNRDPVMSLSEEDVVRTLEKLRMTGFARLSGEGGRVPKYCHCMGEKHTPAELAIIAELLLRGPQTAGELRNRCERMHSFADLSAVMETLDELQKYEVMLVRLLPRQPGQKEQRYVHLLCGEPDLSLTQPEPKPEAARVRVMAENERIDTLERELAELKEEMSALKQTVQELKAAFE